MALHQASCWSNRCMTCRGLDRVVAWGQYLETWASMKSSLGALIYRLVNLQRITLRTGPFFFPQRFWGRASASACWIFKRFVISSSKAGSSKHDRLYKYPPETHLLAQLKTKVHALVTCHALCQPGKWNSALTSR